MRDFYHELSEIIDQTQTIFGQSHFKTTQWLPISQSLLAQKKSASQLKTPYSNPAPSISLKTSEPKITIENRFQTTKEEPTPLLKETPKTESKEFVAIERPSQEIKTKKIGKFTLHLPTDSKAATGHSSSNQEIALWLQKKGLIDQSSPTLQLASTKKTALCPVVIIYHKQTSSLEGLQRLRQAIDEKLLPCCLIEEENSTAFIIEEALDRNRIECFICEKATLIASSLSHQKRLFIIEPEDLIENSRKIETWKKLVHLLRKEA